MKIITDTCIWYNIAEGDYEDGVLKKLPLVITAMTLIEILSSKNLLHPINKYKIKKIYAAIKKHNPIFYNQLPFEYAANKYFGKKLKAKTSYSLIENIINKIEDTEFINNLVEENNARLFEFKEILEKQVEKRKSLIKQGVITKRYIDENYKDYVKGYWEDFLKSLAKHTGISMKSISKSLLEKNGAQINPYIFSSAHYGYKLLFKGNKAHKNDQGDNLNLLYLGINDLYWTTDKKWNGILKDAGCSKLVYNYPLLNKYLDRK